MVKVVEKSKKGDFSRLWHQFSLGLNLKIKLIKIILKDRMSLQKLLIKLPQMSSIFIEIFDGKV